MTEKYKLQQEDINSMDLNCETLAKLKQILPEVFAEGADGKPSIDVERLKIALGGAVDVESDNKSRFSFGWSGKKQAQALANQPSTATLRPSIEDSKNWDNTQNVYIEGDNLEVLKLLQKSYYGQVKMIYIDPPYNTGKDFVYKDNFHDNVKNYLQLTGQVDDEGNKISTNTDKSGRYHTDWLNMMYPRLKLARNLLKDDGVIFISIDDNEVHNLRKICDEIFGEDNFVGLFIVNSSPSGIDYGHIAKTADYALFYAKNILDTFTNQLEEKDKEFRYTDETGGYNLYPLYNGNSAFNDKTRPNLVYPFYLNPHNNYQDDFYEIGLDKQDGWVEVYPVVGQQDCIQRVWRWGKPKSQLNLNNEIVGYKNSDGDFRIVQKSRLTSKVIRSLQLDNKVSSRTGTLEIQSLFSGRIFSYPKPYQLIQRFISISTEQTDIILDFFSGSATTAHAAMQLNAEDGGKRKYICVQLPEATSPESEAYKAGYKNICEIGKERIRRAGEKVFAEWTEKQQKSAQATANAGLFADDAESDTAQTSLDIGFKVFKLDTSNIKLFDVNDMFADDLLVANRSALDLFYELVLKQGYSLDNRQCVLDVGGTSCYALVHEDNTPFVLAVLDDAVKPNFALELLKYALTLVIVKDACFGTDEIKLNLLATLEQLQSKDNPLQIRIV